MPTDLHTVRDARLGELAFTVLLGCTGNICRSALGEPVGRVSLNQELG